MDSNNSTSLVIGGEVKAVGLNVAGQLFVFTPNQMNFLLALQKMKSVMAAALSVDKDEEWGLTFLRSAKFRRYISCKMQQFSEKNGLNVEWWYQFGKWAAEGYRGRYDVACMYCKYSGEMNEYEVESCRGDDLKLEVPCPVCFKVLKVKYKREDFKPSREQVVAWQDLGARLIPKVERVQHSYENTEIIFENSGGAQNG